jgi:hypothetical protein
MKVNPSKDNPQGSIYFSQRSNVLSPHDSNNGIDEPKAVRPVNFSHNLGTDKIEHLLWQLPKKLLMSLLAGFLLTRPIKVSSFHKQLRFCYHTRFFNRRTSHLKIKSYS